MKVFVSHKKYDGITTVFLHDISAQMKLLLQDRIVDGSSASLTINTTFIPLVILEDMHSMLWQDVKVAYDNSTHPVEARKVSVVNIMEGVMQSSKSVYIQQWRLKQLESFLKDLQQWMDGVGEMFVVVGDNPNAFKHAHHIVSQRLKYLEGSLEGAKYQLEAASQNL